MTFRAKELSVDQKTVIEGLLGRSLGEDEAVSLRTVGTESVPEWLRRSWDSAEALGVGELSMEEIDAEIGAARMARRTIVQPESDDCVARNSHISKSRCGHPYLLGIKISATRLARSIS